MLPNKEVIAAAIKHWLIISLLIWLAYFPYAIYLDLTGQTTEAILQFSRYWGQAGGVVIHYVLFWFIIPIAVYRKLQKFFHKETNQTAEINVTNIRPFILTQSGTDYEIKQKRA